MKITKYWLLSRPPKFWNDLLFILEGTSPHFGKLGWKLNKSVFSDGSFWPKLEIDDNLIKSLLEEEIPDDANEEKVCQILMTIIFKVTPDYDPNKRPSTPTYEYEEWEKEDIVEGRYPKYPAYQLTNAPSDYQLLKTEQILNEDIKKFKQKIKVVTGPENGELLKRYRELVNSHQNTRQRINQKLTEWIQLLNSRTG